MRDEEERSLRLPAAERLQPFDRRDVEVVSGFVQKYEVGIVRKRAGEQYAAAQPTGKRVEHGCGIKPHLRNHLAGTGDFLHGAIAVGRHFLLKKRNLETRCAYYLAGIRLD